MHVRPFLSACDTPNMFEKLPDMCATLPGVFEILPNSYETLPDMLILWVVSETLHFCLRLLLIYS